MRVVYMGTPDFAAPALKAIIEAGHEVPAVITQPDRPRGRGKKETPPPVKTVARSLNIPVFQPLRLKDPDFLDILRGLSPEIIVVAAYGRILPAEILYLPRYGCVNAHASLLPKYRGAAPIHWAIIKGEKETGITTMHIDEGLDTGDMILRQSTPIGEEDNVGSVHDRLAVLGAGLMVETLRLLERGEAPRESQTGISSYAPAIKAEDEIINWGSPARDIINLIRGMDPWPGARTYLGGQVLKVWRATIMDESSPVGPGVVMSGAHDGIIIGTGRGLIRLDELQLQGGRRLKAADFARGRPVPGGSILGKLTDTGGGNR